jgi:hypothetical protein
MCRLLEYAAQVFEKTIPLTGTLFKLPSLSTHEFAAVVIAAVRGMVFSKTWAAWVAFLPLET